MTTAIAWFNEQKRQRMRKKRNPIPTIDDVCMKCGQAYAQTHEIFFSNPDARLSQDYGLTVRLCEYHHTGHKEGVHHNRQNDLELKVYGYNRFKEMYPELEFSDIFKTAWRMDLDDYGLKL